MAGIERRQKILFGVLGALVLVFLFRVFMSGGGGGDSSTDRADRGAVTTTLPFALNPSEDDGVTDTVPPSDTSEGEFDVFAGRNPFEPVVGGNGVANTVPPATTPDTSDTTEPQSTPTSNTPPTTVSGDPGATTASTGVPTFDPTRHTVTLLDVYTDSTGAYRASVQVDSTVYTVGAGEQFGGNYSLVTLDASCGQFQYGDTSFQLCEVEQIIK